MISIRYATKRDTNSIASFNSTMAMETEDKLLNAETVQKGVENAFENNKKGFYLIAESDGTQVGQLMITKEWSDWRNGDFWWIQSVYVHPDFRGKGIYKQLYDKVKKLAQSNGRVCGIRLYVEKENITAQKVYSKLGMIETDYLLYEEEF